MDYKGVYKCRLCGELFMVGKRYTDKEVIEKISRMTVILSLSQNDLGYTPHGCKDGAYGIADLQGFKKMDG